MLEPLFNASPETFTCEGLFQLWGVVQAATRTGLLDPD